ncbi:Uncharacterised protein [Vibrio cholerae]|nr:Uncharacterised protein [Vibrio cholerae]CSB63938.1 Uncharacterised protein [Vibrio cholerae]CSD00569.1 Uncharacterised protein [Vibrio cholerae]
MHRLGNITHFGILQTTHHRKLKGGTFTFFTMNGNLPPHKLDQLLTDTQPKPSAPILTRNAVICLRESIEQIVQLVLGNANPCIFDGKPQRDLLFIQLAHSCRQYNFAL